MKHGVFVTPTQKSIAHRMDQIHRAAEARSDNPFFWTYTKAELEDLHRLTLEYRRASEEVTPA